ncbi:branched-chain amino acid transport system ATP-binding protein [Noviherbaspirillum humi]|uniref:Branched-chain amino acid transport system ATP-binding protein n=1 Tax=Noviherbaspirillum humi TaxID=1688639 RepID=A0A239J957_9BURK|nr:ABC transporter ATP-binding protein [Noviherbaspirillum humi]SNT02546.1 branched-chain amino acid transport system ATP-binding protein [Noviherbaspirillum humi]
MATELLALDKVNAFYGDSHVLHDVSFSLRSGRLLALLGRNGAGKSTCINAIVGFLPPRAGSVTLAGKALQKCTPEQICRSGVGLVPQGRRIFPSLTVRENLEVAAGRNPPPGRRRWTREDINQIFPRLKERQHQLAGSLSGGEQQMLAIGRGLMTNPQVLLMDEPSEGLAPQIVREVGNVLEALKREISIVLVEQNLGLAMKVADDVALLNTGRVVFSGTRDEFQERQAELQGHLGVA